jgi:formate dehydrogenase assembly factor FdhD
MPALSPSSCGYCRKMLLNNVVAKDTSSAKNNRSVTLFKIYQFHVILVGFIKIERGKDGTHRLELAA